MLAKDIMNPDVITVSIPGTRDEVLELLKEYGISGVPVVKNGELVGIITRKDIINNPEEEQTALLMTRNPIVVSPDTPLEETISILVKSNIRRLPVVENSKLVGIVTVADVVRAIADMKIDKKAGEFMESSVPAVWDETPLNVAGEIMRLTKSEALPVLNAKTKLVGILTEKEIINRTSLEDLVEASDYSQAGGEDEWMWEGLRDFTRKYFEVTVLKLPDVPVREVIQDTISIYPNTSISEAAKQMVKNKVDQLTVITPEEKLLGIVYDKNIIRAML